MKEHLLRPWRLDRAAQNAGRHNGEPVHRESGRAPASAPGSSLAPADRAGRTHIGGLHTSATRTSMRGLVEAVAVDEMSASRPRKPSPEARRSVGSRLG